MYIYLHKLYCNYTMLYNTLYKLHSLYQTPHISGQLETIPAAIRYNARFHCILPSNVKLSTMITCNTPKSYIGELIRTINFHFSFSAYIYVDRKLETEV